MPEPSPERLTPLEQFAEDVRQEVKIRCADDAPQDQQENAFTEWVLEQLA